MKKTLVVLLIVLLVGVGGFAVDQFLDDESVPEVSEVEENERVEEEAEETLEPAVEVKPGDLTGKWTRNILHYTGHLNILDVTEERFRFTLNVIAGANVGGMEGEAVISGDSATFKTSEINCELTFHFSEDLITIEQSDECMIWGGVGTFFNGEYERGDVKIETDLIEQGVLSESEDHLFKDVVGNDYELYLNNFNVYMEVEDHDGLETKVIKGFVRGIAASNGGIIMINEQYVYAAVTDSDVIRYHSNDPEYKGKLPVTISEWVDEMVMDEVVMESD
ncbi:hypothetical protein [Alkalihalobacillus sp. CinArs1]|uniref:hypothetical protein n=1 Tax=Alkalihalobacillus sp. CinArs1 TaxID=2995314 RepID=UPI0022DD7A45|nr:hypothetical protein [Alkalihalobacillus sp. CinArs1]